LSVTPKISLKSVVDCYSLGVTLNYRLRAILRVTLNYRLRAILRVTLNYRLRAILSK
jgi:hypothetical protein